MRHWEWPLIYSNHALPRSVVYPEEGFSVWDHVGCEERVWRGLTICHKCMSGEVWVVDDAEGLDCHDGMFFAFYQLWPDTDKRKACHYPPGSTICQSPDSSSSLYFTQTIRSQLLETAHLLDATNRECDSEFRLFPTHHLSSLVFDLSYRVVAYKRHIAGFSIQCDVRHWRNSLRVAL